MGARGKRRESERERQPADNPIAWEVFRGGHHVKVSFLCATSGTLSRPARTQASLATLARAANNMCERLFAGYSPAQQRKRGLQTRRPQQKGQPRRRMPLKQSETVSLNRASGVLLKPRPIHIVAGSIMLDSCRLWVQRSGSRGWID